MFWDGERWIDERALRTPPPHSRRKVRDWIATAIVIIGVAALALPLTVTSAAAPPDARTARAQQAKTHTVTTVQESSGRISYRGSWSLRQHDRYLGRFARATDQAGARLTFTFKGSGISWVGPVGPTRGKARVYIDGELVKTVNTYRSRFLPTRVLYQWKTESVGRHKITIVALGTAGHPTVALDAFLVRGAAKADVAGVVAAAPVVPSPASSVVPSSLPSAVASALPSVTPSTGPTSTPAASATPSGAPTPTATPTPKPSATPAPTPTPAPTSTPTPASGCPGSLQTAINAAAIGSTLNITGCTFRQAVTVNKRMTIKGGTIDGEGARLAVSITASDVVIDGLTVRNTRSSSLWSGAIDARDVNRVTLRNVRTSGSAGGPGIWLEGGSGHRIENADVGSNGSTGLHLQETTDVTVSGGRYHHANTVGTAVNPGQEAGGIKACRGSGFSITGIEADNNNGPGIWLDCSANRATVSNNRAHHNTRQGIHFEISDGATITGNAVWENGFGFSSWGWGAGILISSAKNANVYGNTVAWNADGIAVLSQNRSPYATGNNIHDNVVVQSGGHALGWLQDYSGPLFSSGTNRGSGNDYWGSHSYAWNGDMTSLASFNATPGEEAGVTLTTAQRDAALTADGIPLSP